MTYFFFQHTFILRRPVVVNFTGIIRIATMVIKAAFGEKMLTSTELKSCVAWFIYFPILFQVGITVPLCNRKFHRCRTCVTYFRERGLFIPPSVSSLKRTYHKWGESKLGIRIFFMLQASKSSDGSKYFFYLGDSTSKIISE